MSSFKSVIIVNHSICYLAGSELVTLDLARYFKESGWNIYVGCYELSVQFKLLFEKIGVSWIDLNISRDMSGVEIDLLIGHHFTAFDRLLIDFRLKPKKVIFSSLSPFEAIESPPLYHKYISVTTANSIETYRKLIEFGISKDRLFLFENCVPDHYFKINHLPSNLIRKIAVISNHVPDEIIGAMNLFYNIDIKVDFYGFDFKSVLITPDILIGYDLVVTIGRTVQQCFALGIPIYCYDRFGGPGYLNDENFEKAAEFNFSGRCTHRKLVSYEIFGEILGGYESSLQLLPAFKKAAKRRFLLSKVIERLLCFSLNKYFESIPLSFLELLGRKTKYYGRKMTESYLKPSEVVIHFDSNIDFDEKIEH